MRKLLSNFLILLLIITLIPNYTGANNAIFTEQEKIEAVLFSENIGEEVPLHESVTDILLEKISHSIPDETLVELVDLNFEELFTSEELLLLEDYIFIRYETNKELQSEIIEGFVHKDFVVNLENVESFRQKRVKYEDHSYQENKYSNKYEESPQQLTEAMFDSYSSTDASPQSSITGLAIKHPVAVYSETDRNSKVLKTYPYGRELKFRRYKEDWHEATVYINGTPEIGYIHASDVGDHTQASAVRGIALKKSINVYSGTDDEKHVLKSYNQGHILKYQAYNNDWFKATVKYNGNWTTGYISTKDVETAVHSPETLQGVGMKQPTSVYERASNSSKTLKSYHYGAVLKFKEFTSSWYEATVYIKGKPKTGYIQLSDIGPVHQTLNGYAVKNPTVVYEKTSKSSKKLKSYPIGSTLKYRPYNNTWFRATVIINGKPVQGYLHAKDVVKNAPTLQGYAYNNPTVVYEKTSKNSKALKSYKKGSPLKYRPYSKNWYRATVINNGKREQGFIHAKDVGSKAPTLIGYAYKSPTNIYTKTSRNSKKLKSYSKGSKLKYRYYNSNWYIATVYIKGKKHTGFIHKNDVGFTKQSTIVNPYKTYSYNHMINDIVKLQQMYPDLIQYKVVGKSEYGRNIYAVGLGKGKATTFINGSIHAREWISTNLNMYMLENYAKAYQSNSKIQGYNVRQILNNTTIWFMPMVNPDGVTLQQQGLKAIPKKDHATLTTYNGGSKDFKRWKANAKGVDINRNFGVDWHNQNSPKGPSFQNYRGLRAHSSKEAQAVVKLVNEINPQMTINYHSSGQVLYWSYKQTGARYSRDILHARKISSMTGYTLIPKSNDPKGGGFLQWFTETKKMPSYTPELAPYVGNTNPSPTRHFPDIWRENQAVGLYAAQESYKLYRK